MLDMNIKYNSRNSVLLPFWGIAVNFGGGGGGRRYFRDLIGGQKINVTFGGGGGRYFQNSTVCQTI